MCHTLHTEHKGCAFPATLQVDLRYKITLIFFFCKTQNKSFLISNFNMLKIPNNLNFESFRFEGCFLSMDFPDVSWSPSTDGRGKLNQNLGHRAHFFESKIGF